MAVASRSLLASEALIALGAALDMAQAREEAPAIALAADTDHTLSAAIFARDTACRLRAARQSKPATCHINGPMVHDEAQMSFGGRSGLAFTKLRWVTPARA